MARIVSLSGLEILDSRGNPTLKVFCHLDDGTTGFASVPSGASTGKYEAVELRDGDKKRFGGKGVQKALHTVQTTLSTLLKGKDPFDQELIDRLMIDADGTENKSHFGANAILGASLAVCHAAAISAKKPLFSHIGGVLPKVLPIPMMNIINGGKHADNTLDFQEFMIRPHGFSSFSEALRAGCEIFHTLKQILHTKKLSTSVGDEGGFAPNLSSHEEAIELILQAIETAGYTPKKQVSIALDCAASEFFDEKEHVYFEMKKKEAGKQYRCRNSEEVVSYLAELVSRYPIDSIEDGLDQSDWEGWRLLTTRLGKKIQLVGDDIFVTNPKFLKRGFTDGVANAILVKPNQIGTLTETLETIRLAQSHGYKTIISHRSGETEDTTIADIAVATGSGQIKTGSLCRSDRVAKYNRLLLIEHLISDHRYGM